MTMGFHQWKLSILDGILPLMKTNQLQATGRIASTSDVNNAKRDYVNVSK